MYRVPSDPMLGLFWTEPIPSSAVHTSWPSMPVPGARTAYSAPFWAAAWPVVNGTYTVAPSEDTAAVAWNGAPMPGLKRHASTNWLGADGLSRNAYSAPPSVVA